MAWLSNAFNWVMNNKAAQYVLLFFGALLAFKTVQMKARMEGAAEERRKGVERTRKTVQNIEDKSDAHIEQADQIRAANPVSPYDNSMSDTRLPDYHYRN